MKNQYVGDINDYVKYGLIHSIAKIFDNKILFVWMLTENENNDGNKIEYLNNSQKYRHYNPELFDELKNIVANKQKYNNIDNIIAIEKNKLFNKYSFFNEFIKDDKKLRGIYFQKVNNLAKEYDTIFFDPDNGIEVPSCKYGGKKSSKYIYWNEIKDIYELKKNILIYQHFPRKDREKFTKDLVKRCKTKFKNAEIVRITTKHTLFIFIVQNFKNLIEKLIVELDIWKEKIEIGK